MCLLLSGAWEVILPYKNTFNDTDTTVWRLSAENNYAITIHNAFRRIKELGINASFKVWLKIIANNFRFTNCWAFFASEVFRGGICETSRVKIKLHQFKIKSSYRR